MPGMSEGAFHGWKSPEGEWMAGKKENLSFEQRVEFILKNGGEARIQRDAKMIEDIFTIKDPENEKQCEAVAVKHNLDAAMISAIALRLQDERAIN